MPPHAATDGYISPFRHVAIQTYCHSDILTLSPTQTLTLMLTRVPNPTIGSQCRIGGMSEWQRNTATYYEWEVDGDHMVPVTTRDPPAPGTIIPADKMCLQQIPVHVTLFLLITNLNCSEMCMQCRWRRLWWCQYLACTDCRSFKLVCDWPDPNVFHTTRELCSKSAVIYRCGFHIVQVNADGGVTHCKTSPRCDLDLFFILFWHLTCTAQERVSLSLPLCAHRVVGSRNTNS